MALLHEISTKLCCSYKGLLQPMFRCRSHLTKPQSLVCFSAPEASNTLRSGCRNPAISIAKCSSPWHQIHAKSAIHTSGNHSSAFEDRETKALVVWNNLKEVRKSPVPALTLGLCGLLPFVAAPAYLVMCGTFLPHIATAQIAYGATILSFLGGVRWGFTIPEENPIQPDWTNLGYSVTPSLVAWTGLLLPSPFSLFTIMGGLVFAGYMDFAMFGYPPWFKGLRFTLTFVALLSLWTTFVCSLLLSTDDDNQS